MTLGPVECFVLRRAVMPVPFPHRYRATISRTFASRGRVDAPPRPSLHAGPSSEFSPPLRSGIDSRPPSPRSPGRFAPQAPPGPLEVDGDAAAWSPEHLLLSSLGIGLLTTFEAFCARDGIEVLDWNATINATVDRSPEGLMFSSIVVSIDMELAGAVEALERSLADTKQYCLVLNSLRVPVVIETQVRTPDQRPDVEPERQAG